MPFYYAGIILKYSLLDLGDDVSKKYSETRHFKKWIANMSSPLMKGNQPRTLKDICIHYAKQNNILEQPELLSLLPVELKVKFDLYHTLD
jgi:hypothetical protein